MPDATMDIEIFATGEYHGRTFTVRDLDEMVANFVRVAHAIKPPLKLGHDDAQLLAGQKDGDPALGWVTALRRVGGKVVATVAGVPQKLADMIRRGRYRRVSSEIYVDFATTEAEKNLQSGVTGKVLSGVALLGADVPAVKTLDDLAAWCGADLTARVLCATLDTPERFTMKKKTTHAAKTKCSECGYVGAAAEGSECPECGDGTMRAMGTDDMTEGSHAEKEAAARAAEEKRMADEKFTELEQKLAKLTEQLAAKDAETATALKQRDEQIATLTEQAKQAETRAAVEAAKALHAEATAWAEDRCKAGNLKLFPAQKFAAVKLYESLSTEPTCKVVFAEGEPEVATSLRDVFVRLVEAYPDQKHLLKEVTKDTPPQLTDADVWLAERAKALGKSLENAADKRELTILMAKERPDLANTIRTVAA